MYDKKSNSQSFFTFMKQIINDLKASDRIGTAESYSDTYNAVNGFSGGKDLSFADINYNFLIRFEARHIGKGNSYNGLAVYMCTIRAAFNKAVKAGLVEKDLYPFGNYKIKTVPTEKRALEFEFLQKIIFKDLSAEHICFNARNYFVASYMMYGINFTDMAFLQKDNIIDGRVQYRRNKTSKLYDIKITDNLKSILAFYMALTPDSPYIFPISKRG